LQLVIEVDGSVHDVEEVKQADSRRQEELENCGLKFLRFTNDEVKFNLDEVKQKIESYILKIASQT
jgi:cyclase